MLETAALIIFLISFTVTLVIVVRKIPVLVKIPQTSSPGSFGIKDIASKTHQEIKKSGLFQKVSPEKILHRTLSKVRVLTLKTDHKTSSWLQRLREKSQKKKFGSSDNYWKQIRKMTKK